MWIVELNIGTDGDFSYIDDEFNLHHDEPNSGGTDIFYFERREDAVNAILRSFNNLTNSFRAEGFENIEKWLKDMNQKMPLFCRKISSFVIGKDFGNQVIEYSLIRAKEITLPNGGITHVWYGVDIDYSMDDIDLLVKNDLLAMPDVKTDEKTLPTEYRKFPVYIAKKPYTMFLNCFTDLQGKPQTYTFDFFNGCQDVFASRADYHYDLHPSGNKAVDFVSIVREYISNIEDQIQAEEKQKEYWDKLKSWDGWS